MGFARTESEINEPKSRKTAGKSVNRQTQKFTRNTTLRTTEILTRDSFEVIKKLGDGAYGIVYMVRKKIGG